DMDFSKHRRDDVMKIMETMYGAEKLASIANYGKWKPRGVITDVGRVLGFEFTDLKRITKYIDNKVEEWDELPSEVVEFLDRNKMLKNRARRLMGTVNYKGIHASGIVITPSDMGEWIPIAFTTDRTSEAKPKVRVSEWDMYALEDLNLLKFDRLGLTTLDVIQQTIELVNKNHGKDTIGDLDKICLDDLENKHIYDMLRNQELQGLFQVEKSQGMARLIRDMKPVCFNDIALIISLFRTAVLKAGMHTEYVNRRRLAESGKADKIKFIHPLLKEMPFETHGVLIFQEQVMAIGHIMGGLTLKESDNFRKA
ncbi:unnamed protein product, partial [marine sediment metagenome]